MRTRKLTSPLTQHRKDLLQRYIQSSQITHKSKKNSVQNETFSQNCSNLNLPIEIYETMIIIGQNW